MLIYFSSAPLIAAYSLNILTVKITLSGFDEFQLAPRPVQTIDEHALPWACIETILALSKPLKPIMGWVPDLVAQDKMSRVTAMIHDICIDYSPYTFMENLKIQLLQYINFSHQKIQATNNQIITKNKKKPPKIN